MHHTGMFLFISSLHKFMHGIDGTDMCNAHWLLDHTNTIFISTDSYHGVIEHTEYTLPDTPIVVANNCGCPPTEILQSLFILN